MKGYLIRKIYVIICDKCNEDITRPHGGIEPTSRREAEQMARDHDKVWHRAAPPERVLHRKQGG